MGEVGEVVLRGPQVMNGYWNRPQETSEAMRDGWFYTGDLAYMDERGLLLHRRPQEGRHQCSRLQGMAP